MNAPTTIFIANALLFGFLGWFVGARKARPVLGLVLGALLSWIGLIVIVLLPRAERTAKP